MQAIGQPGVGTLLTGQTASLSCDDNYSELVISYSLVCSYTLTAYYCIYKYI